MQFVLSEPEFPHFHIDDRRKAVNSGGNCWDYIAGEGCILIITMIPLFDGVVLLGK